MKKNVIIVFAAVMLTAILLLLSGCGSNKGKNKKDTTITLTPSAIELKINETATLTAALTNSSISIDTISWMSEDPKVVTVVGNNLTATVTGVARGKSDITIRIIDVNGKAYTAKSTVYSDTIRVTGIELDITNKTLDVGEDFILNATVYPLDATFKDIIWEVVGGNKNAVTLDTYTGTQVKVTAMQWGTALVTAKTVDGNFNAVCEVNVSNKLVNRINVTFDRSYFSRNSGSPFSNPDISRPSNIPNNLQKYRGRNNDYYTLSGRLNGNTLNYGVVVDGQDNLLAIIFPRRTQSPIKLSYNILPNDAFDKSFTWSAHLLNISNSNYNVTNTVVNIEDYLQFMNAEKTIIQVKSGITSSFGLEITLMANDGSDVVRKFDVLFFSQWT